MGEVYLARDTVLRREVAIKFVAAARLDDPGAEALLLQEARAAATLDHPGICPIYDVHVDGQGRTCIVMQYVEGETLAARLARGTLEPAVAVDLAAAIADALAAAHARGIVHRDLKPQNVIIMPNGHPKLLDFGIAQVNVPENAAAEVATHTATSDWSGGAIVGTPAYMSPEQVLRKTLDGRSDLFSLGAVLFECLTAQPAFLAATHMETWGRVVYSPQPPPSVLNPSVPPALDAVVARLLAKEPDGRYATAADAASALRGTSDSASMRHWWTRREWAAAAMVIGVLSLGGFGAWRVFAGKALPTVPAAAREHYERGLQHLRDGAYARAEKSLAEAVAIHAQYPRALARLAEARSELDDEASAQDAVMRIGDMTRAGFALPRDERVRVDAISALLENDLPRAEAGYRTLAERDSGDRGGWLDLARVRQRAGRKDEAMQAAQRALQISPNYAAAHLRLGTLAAEALHRDEAIKEFKEAERLYGIDSVTEGQAEAMLQRALFLDAIGDFTASRQVLADVEQLRPAVDSPYLRARATMLRSSLTASAGDVQGARRLAQEAVAAAQTAGLDTVAADVLVQSAATSLQLRDYDAARADLRHSVELAKRSGAKRVALRSTLQLASVHLDLGETTDARNLASGMLDFAHGRYPREEMIALSIVGRSYEDTNPREAERLARQVLPMARALHDDREVAGALDGLIGPAVTLGSLPEALDLRRQLEQLQRQLHDTSNLAINLTGLSDLLIRLGRYTEAEGPLGEIEREAAAGQQIFVGRLRRSSVLRAIAASENNDFPQVITRARAIVAASPSGKPDAPRLMAEALLVRAQAALGRRQELRAWPPFDPASMPMELLYWRAAAMLANADYAGVQKVAAEALKDIDTVPSPEFEWRMTAIAAAAARRSGDLAKADSMRRRAQTALDAVRAAWKDAAADYERRPDLNELKRNAGLS